MSCSTGRCPGQSSPNEDFLKTYGKNLTQLAKENKIDPVIDRDDEIRRIIRILSRKTKNNPVLVGEPGVGKTAIVEGFAKKIVEKQVPDKLLNTELWEISLSSITANASYQGQLEGRIKGLLEQIEKLEGKVIVFIDEIHMLMGVGGNGGSTMNLSNMLKPMMARGRIKLIGATTIDEYKQYIEKDAALERRMQKVDVLEPSVEGTITILRGIKNKFEMFHDVKITDSALVYAAQLSTRYISDRFLPDKAIDLIDEAAANTQVESNYKPEKLEKLEQKLGKLKVEELALKKEKLPENKERLEKVKQEIEKLSEIVEKEQNKWKETKTTLEKINQLKKQKDDLENEVSLLFSDGKYKEVSKIKAVDIPKVEKEIEEVEKKYKELGIKDKVVSKEEIAQVVSKWTKIPVTKLVEEEVEKILNLKETLSKRVKGQDHALKLVSNTILRSKSGINDPDKPIGSFMFMGSTGVGKTELARALAFNLFDSEKQLIRLDMSEYMEKHEVSKLIGAPPGYVGYDQGGQLTDKVRENPYSIVLFDEIEKAHGDIVNIFLQILDNGQLKDSKDRTINFRNTIIIFTTNLGAEDILQNPKMDNKGLREILMRRFKPEFINRIDQLIAFNPLSKEIIKGIADLELKKLAERIFKVNQNTLMWGEEVLDFICEEAYDPEFGARPIKRYIKEEFETIIASALIEKQFSQKDTIKAIVENDKIQIIKV